jgi:hypothetical protein
MEEVHRKGSRESCNCITVEIILTSGTLLFYQEGIFQGAKPEINALNLGSGSRLVSLSEKIKKIQ